MSAIGNGSDSLRGVQELPAEWERLKQVRPELEGWKAELRANAIKRLEMGPEGKLPPLTPGQVVEQQIFHIFVDRPIVKERITTKLQRTFYEREYVRVTKLVNEVKLPTTVEHLGREKIILGDSESVEQGLNGRHAALPPAATSETRSQPSATPNGHSTVADSERPGGMPPGVRERPGLGGPGGQERRRSFNNPFKRSSKSDSNPFAGFAQPVQPELPVAQLQAQEPAKNPKKKGLRWCFSAPFTQDGTIAPPHKSQLNVELLSQASTSDAASTAHAPSLPPSAGPPRQQNDHRASEERDAVHPGQGTGGNLGGGSIGKEVSPHEAAVKAALVAGAADESQHETFTQVEEEAVTFETIERFVEHVYYQREYVIVVTYKGETLLPRSYELLSRERFLKPELPETGIVEVS
jgi:hypothetical protein